MVRKSYRSVYRPQSFEFRGTQRIDGNIVQPLAVIGPTGVSETALYIMEEQPDGTGRSAPASWRRNRAKIPERS